jgi:hypothetical protein
MPGRVDILSTHSPAHEAAAHRTASQDRRLEPAAAAADKLLFRPRWR